MPHILKNEHLELEIDLPLEGYNFSRFDWTGKIVSVKYKNIIVAGVEKLHDEVDTKSGKGFYNEFGIDAALGYSETADGDWFHKIGVGLLQKEGETYQISHQYAIQPAAYTVVAAPGAIIITCSAPACNGYSYVLQKEIKLVQNGFIIQYLLQNTGEKIIDTDEYNHNFLAINKQMIGSDYQLKFPFYIQPALFGETVNTEGKVDIGEKEITFNGNPSEQFFFSNLSGGENVQAYWKLINTKTNIGISETGSFTTNKINVWGWRHVISPELFFNITVSPGNEIEWARTYQIFDIQ